MNWQSFLGEYEPSAGDYGLRFLVRGTQLIDKQAKVVAVVVRSSLIPYIFEGRNSRTW